MEGKPPLDKFDALLRDIDTGTSGEEAFVDRAISAILEAEDPASMLRPLLRPVLAGRYRARVRALEQSVSGWAVPPRNPADRYPGARRATSNAALERRRMLLHQRIHVPGSGEVEWGKATVDQLRERVNLLRSKRAGLDDTITKLEDAIKVIRETPGAKCLNDVYAGAS